jgi:hypothetical protein
VKDRRPFRIGCVGALLVEATFFYAAARTGLYFLPLNGIFFIPILLVGYGILGWFVKRFATTTQWQLGLRAGYWMAIVALFTTWGYVAGTPKAVFERLAMKPMPESVQNFEWRGAVGIDGHFRYAFQADPDDTRHLIKHLRLEPATNQSQLHAVAFAQSGFSQSHKTIESPVLYFTTKPWRVELITDAEHRQVYVFW